MKNFEHDNEQYEDFQGFLSELGDVTPLKNNDYVALGNAQQSIRKQLRRAALESSPPHSCPLSFEGVTPLTPDDYLDYKQAGIQSGVYKNLRLGKYAIEQKISLTGLSLPDSANLLYQKLQSAHQCGVRSLLIQHGMGRDSKPFPALKKSYVNFWLKQLEIVIAFHSAQPQHGGLGATYVLLKKHPNQKAINREKQAKR